MHDLLIFRDNETDFERWCSHNVRRARSIIRLHEHGQHSIRRYSSFDDYNDALIILRQYTILKASLDKKLQRYLDFTLIERKEHTWNSTYFQEIYRTWKEICFYKKHPKIKKLDAIKLGQRLRKLRMDSGFSAAKISGILKISPKSLYSYEEGSRMINADILYRLSQIYNVSIDEMILSLKKE